GDSVAIVIRRDAGVSGSVTVILRTVGGGESWISEINVQPSPNNFTIGSVLANRLAAAAATANADYAQLDSAVTFADGETSKTVQLSIIKDAIPELEETVLVYISLPASSPGAQMPRLADGTAKDGFKTVSLATFRHKQSDLEAFRRV
uniref:Calx-beta domain-containing protein n=1 Tax=Macrostomum lignano TaxID=282301 RepID=A0A1I8JLQ9_9PLAT